LSLFEYPRFFLEHNSKYVPFYYSLRVKAIYDDNFKEKFGDDTANAARRVLAQAQNLFKLRDSLTTEVILTVDPNVAYIPGKWVAGNDL